MIHVLIGTRAQLIKMLPIMHGLQQRGLAYNFIFMAQHRATVHQILDDFGLKRPDYAIADDGEDIVRTTQMIWWSARALAQGLWFRKLIFQDDKDGVVLVHGDAPPLLLGALMAKAQGLKVAQVEAGLRSFDYLRPFPEEVTRVLAGKLGLIDLHFCQDESAVKNAGRYRGRVVNTLGNTIYDALGLVKPEGPVPAARPYAVVSMHRYETLTDRKRLSYVVEKLLQISLHVPLLFVLHPPTRVALENYGLLKRLESAERITATKRMSFAQFNRTLRQAEFLISDGGSNQEESAYLGLPCLLLRENTERTEGIDKNVVLSRFDDQLIDDFVHNYARYRVKAVVSDQSPTQIVLDEIARFS